MISNWYSSPAWGTAGVKASWIASNTGSTKTTGLSVVIVNTFSSLTTSSPVFAVPFKAPSLIVIFTSVSNVIPAPVVSIIISFLSGLNDTGNVTGVPLISIITLSSNNSSISVSIPAIAILISSVSGSTPEISPIKISPAEYL